tara:strand:+ start:739 stop:1092 length:354 start_codon:yes stop_codon:yes gene_type:complete
MARCPTTAKRRTSGPPLDQSADGLHKVAFSGKGKIGARGVHEVPTWPLVITEVLEPVGDDGRHAGPFHLRDSPSDEFLLFDACFQFESNSNCTFAGLAKCIDVFWTRGEVNLQAVRA